MRRFLNKSTALIMSAFLCVSIVSPSVINAQEEVALQDVVETTDPTDVSTQTNESLTNQSSQASGTPDTAVEAEKKSEGVVTDFVAENQNDEEITDDQNVDSSVSTDVNKPVLKSVSIEQNGTPLENGSLVKGGSTIDFVVNAYDLDSGISHIEVNFHYTYDGQLKGPFVWGLYQSEEDIYTTSYTLPEEACDSLYISSVKVVDNNNNSVVQDFSSDEHFINVDAKEPEIHIGEITDIEFERNGTEITQDEIVLEQNIVPITVKMKDCSSVGHLRLNFSTVEEKKFATFGAYLYRSYEEGASADEGTFEGYLTRSSWVGNEDLSGEYVLDSVVANVYVLGQEVSVDLANMSDYRFTYVCKDYTGPEIVSVEMDQVGKVLETGDTVNFKIEATDDSGLKDTGTLTLQPAYDGQEHDQIDVPLTLDSSTNTYTGSYTITDDDYPIEYTLRWINITDIYDNSLGSYTDFSKDYYFQVIHGDTTVYPTRDIEVSFMAYDKSGVGYTLSSKKLTQVVNRSTLDELGIDLSLECPVPFEGLKFLGWSLDGENIATGEDQIYLGQYDEFVTLFPIFDKDLYSIDVSYVSNDLSIEHKKFTGSIEKGVTTEELINLVLSDVSFENMYNDGFVVWQSVGSGGQGATRYINVEARYDKKVVYTSKTYLADDGYLTSDTHAYFVDEGATYEEFEEKLAAGNAPSDLYPGLRFLGWQVNDYNHGTIPMTPDYTFINAIAETENAYVQYVLDPAYKMDDVSTYATAGGMDITMPAEFTYVQITEKNTTVTVPEKFDGYESFEVYQYGMGGTGGITLTGGEPLYVRNSMSLYGYGVKEDADPEEPTEPEEPGDSEQPVLPDVPVELPKEEVEQIVDKIENSTSGELVEIPMEDATVVNKEILEAVKGKDVDVVLNMGDYQWTINGQDVKETDLQDINLEVTFDTKEIPENIVDSVAQGRPVKQLSLTYEGNFGFKGSMRFYMGTEFAGQYGNLYYYDSDGKMVFMNAGLIGEDGYATVTFSHASEYAVVVDKEVLGDVEEEPNQPDGSNELPQVVIDAIQEINDKTSGIVRVPMGSNTIVNEEVLDAVKGKNIDVVFEMEGYTWTINGLSIANDHLSDIDLAVTFDTNAIPENVVNNLAQGLPVKQLSLAHNGEFGFTGALRFNMGKEYAGQYGNLYYYNDKGELEFMNAGLIDANGYVCVTFTHASDYVIVVDQEAQGETPSDPSTPNQDTNTGNQGTADKDTTNTNTEKETTKDDVSTSVETNSTIFVVSMIVAFVAFVGLLMIGKHSKRV